MSRTQLSLFVVSLLASTSVGQAATSIISDFNSGTDEGWTIISGNYSVQASNGAGISAGVPTGGHNPVVIPDPFGSRDGDTVPLVYRSPTFMLMPGSYISAELVGGNAGTLSITNTSALPAMTSTSGFQGVALRRVSDGAYLLSDGKTSNGTAWQSVGFSSTDLDPFAIASPTETYTLDFLDLQNGGWGWSGLNDVAIVVPEPSRTLLVSFGLSLLLLQRRRS